MPRIKNTAEFTMEELVAGAKQGNKALLEELVRRIQDGVYGLALRMLYIPADAEDAAQEILIKVVIHLGGFKGESSFTTWVYKIASNHLLTLGKNRAERWGMSFDGCEQAIEETLQDRGPLVVEAEQNLIAEETKRSCLMYLLLCLKRKLRITFILGEILGVDSVEGSKILDTTPAAFRQNLARGRSQVFNFLNENCGLVDSGNPCRCNRLAGYHVKKKFINPNHLFFAAHPCRSDEREIEGSLSVEMDRLHRAAVFIRSNPNYTAPGRFVESIKHLIESGSFKLLE